MRAPKPPGTPCVLAALLVLVALPGAVAASVETASAVSENSSLLPSWPGRYAGSRILGGESACIVYSEHPGRTDSDFGVTHYYIGGYARDYVRAAYPEFRFLEPTGRGWTENARGLVEQGGHPGARRTSADLRLSAGDLFVRTSFASLRDSRVHVAYSTFATTSGTLIWEIELHNAGSMPCDVEILPVLRFREAPSSLEHAVVGGNQVSTAVFPGLRLSMGFPDDRHISAVSREPEGFPGLRKRVTVPAHATVRSRMVLSPRGEEGLVSEACDLETARLGWRAWFDAGVRPSLGTPAMAAAYDAALTAVAATAQRGAVPADMTGQFVTEGRPQLYPRDALMTARFLAEAGQTGLAAQIVSFWNADIPEKVPGEWYARYDAEARPTPGGTGAPFDLPEWDANGYYATMALRLFALTGRRVDDSALLHRLLDFVLARQDTDGLLREGGIIEWEGLLPATTMNVAVGLRHGALIAEMDGDREAARRWRAAAGRMDRGLDRLFSRQRGAYMDFREGREQFNTSTNFGFLWGYPDHLELALTNAWYRERAFHLGWGVRYFEADGYGSDLFGFTTGASAQLHILADDPAVGSAHIRWMMERSNAYGMMPERVLSPDGADVSPASPLSWCNAEFAAALLAAARVADPTVEAGSQYAWLMLGRELAGVRRILEGLAAAGVEAGSTRSLASSIQGALVACASREPWAAKAKRVGITLSRLERELPWFDPVEPPSRRRGTTRAPSWREDLGAILRGVRTTFDRLVWNEAGTRMRTSGPSVVALDDPRPIRVELEGPDGTRWRTITLEWRDANRVRRTTTRAVTSRGPRAAIDLPIDYRLGTPPYEAAWRVTAGGELGGVSIRASRSGLMQVRPRFTATQAIEDRGGPEGDSLVPGRLESGPRILRIRSEGSAIPERVLLMPSPGWMLEPFPPDTDGHGWSWRAVPGTDAVPGHHAFRFYALPPAGLRAADRRRLREETAVIVVPHAMAMELTGTWKFRTGDDSRWATGTTQEVPDRTGWGNLLVPGNWEAHGYPDYDGFAWYRTAVHVPDSWRGRDLWIVLGAVDDEDWTYWNGEPVGHLATWNQERRYRIPADLVRAGQENTLAVRVYDGLYGGGIWRGPVRLEVAH